MTMKAALIASLAIMSEAIEVGLVLLFLFVDPRAANANERAALLGQGVAMLCLVPLAVIWIKWAAEYRKERERLRSSRPEGRRNPCVSNRTSGKAYCLSHLLSSLHRRSHSS